MPGPLSVMPFKTNFKSDQPTRLKDRTAAKREIDRQWIALCRYVDQRDGRKCRACGRKVIQTFARVPERAERHHVVPRSLGGESTKEGVCLLCASCHDDRHVWRTLQISGNAEETLTFQQFSGGQVVRTWTSSI